MIRPWVSENGSPDRDRQDRSKTGNGSYTPFRPLYLSLLVCPTLPNVRKGVDPSELVVSAVLSPYTYLPTTRERRTGVSGLLFILTSLDWYSGMRFVSSIQTSTLCYRTINRVDHAQDRTQTPDCSSNTTLIKLFVGSVSIRDFRNERFRPSFFFNPVIEGSL